MKNHTIILAAGFVLFWNSGFIGAEYALPYTGPFTLLFWRYWALTFVLLIYLRGRGGLHWPGGKPVLIETGVGILAHGVWLGCVLYSLQYGVPAGIVALVVALQPMATGALSGYVLGEHTSYYRWAGLLTGFGGVAVTVLARIDFSDNGSVFGYFIPFGSVAGMTAASLIQRKLEIQKNAGRLPVDMALLCQSLGTALVVTIPAIFAEGLQARWTAPFAASMLWLVFGVSLAAYALMWQLIARIEATRVASLFYLGPPVTMLMAWAAFGDRLLFTDIIGLLIVASGVLLTQIAVHLNKKPAPAQRTESRRPAGK